MQQAPKQPTGEPENARPGSAAEMPERIDSSALLKGKSELLIQHQGREYRLRLTAQGKLILTA